MKFCIIGLGRFGYQVATGLAENGMEVLAIDSSETIIASIRDLVTHAICMRVIDETSLTNIGVQEMDTVVVATGEDFAQTILITALLKKRLHIKHVIARAINDIHREILYLTGADEVVLPEREIGIRLAGTLSHPFTELLQLNNRFSISQIKAPDAFVGKTIQKLALYKTYQVHCIAVKLAEEIVSVSPEYQVQKDDILLLSGNNKDLEKMARL
ncbi:MAG TPA: TrkA family potassium uptake protein [Candidatus Babeliales bacterium]|nr:TrkA family potassium uptake protein [Candidatus Babeliales bacterium]